MDDAGFWDFRNPLSFDLQGQARALLQVLPVESRLHNSLSDALASNDVQTLLSTASSILAEPSATINACRAFQPILIDLCARWLNSAIPTDTILSAFGLLIDIHEELFPVLQKFLSRPDLKDGPLSCTSIAKTDVPTLHRILLAYYRILKATDCTTGYALWDFSLLHQLFSAPYPDPGVCWLAIRCYTLQCGIGEKAREELERKALGEPGVCDCIIAYGENMQGEVQTVDGWLLPIIESERIEKAREELLDSPEYYRDSTDSRFQLSPGELSPSIVNLHGVLFFRTPPTQDPQDGIILTKSAVLSARKIALQLSMCMPTLLTSSPSAGKLTILKHLATQLHPAVPSQIVVIHVADTSLDPRSLLGTYASSSERSGTFEWKDGVLVKALREGRWVVFKDIDKASSEVLGLIGPLVESLDDSRKIGARASISVPNRGTVYSADGFALFATRSVESSNDDVPPPSFLHAHKWSEVKMASITDEDLVQLVNSKFAVIAGPVADSLILLWRRINSLRSSSSRSIGIRDLEKLCERLGRLLCDHAMKAVDCLELEDNTSFASLFPNPSFREEVFLEARDIFFAYGALNQSQKEHRDSVCAAVGDFLGISPETREWLLTRRSDPFELQKDIDGRLVSVQAGHVVLRVSPADEPSSNSASRTFSLHRQAKRLLAQISSCIVSSEPVLLTGETGTGKTSAVTYLASLLNRQLVSLNLSNQTEASDLIGGFRPVGARGPAHELQETFVQLFEKTFSKKKSPEFFESVQKSVRIGKWKSAVKLWYEAIRMAKGKLHEVAQNDESHGSDELDSSTPRKRRKTHTAKGSLNAWSNFEVEVRRFEVQHIQEKGKFAFQFVEGPLVKALRSGAWILLDEINLASSETLECISSLLQSSTSSITLTEQGSLEPVPRHPEFRIFACMNPATDVGKRDLPGNIRSKFTELDVPPPDDDPETLIEIIAHYIGHLTTTDKTAGKTIVTDVAQFYTAVKALSDSGKLSDGSNHRPHYSMRTLARALTFACDNVQTFGLRRALWEGCTMAFTMVLDSASIDLIMITARSRLLATVRNPEAFISQIPSARNDSSLKMVQFGAFWLKTGPLEPEEASDYVLTPSVQKKLVNLARIITAGRYPVLIEGPTSSGKTSAIEYLARRTGHSFVRINNHEHTDIQEYIGSYISDPITGKMTFQDGLLVQALRRGDWLVLDELNLAPTDVLEALNRLLDDNRELFITETQEVVRPHPHFMLFATQNPPGLYGGRKVLSRALRNRFLEVQFEDVPPSELEFILCQRARIAPSYSKRIVAVFHELQTRRQGSRVFEGKSGFATLRDLFRWAGRESVGYQELAEDGYMLLAERARRAEDKQVVKEVMEDVMKVSISEDALYDSSKLADLPSLGDIAWTAPMRRLYCLLSRALQFNEPVLLVGETGSGKTTVCELFAQFSHKSLHTVNCHQNTEASDIIGGQRPNRDPTSANILHWVDGPLIKAMISGDVFLLDEISLADDSVLERLNSVLEPSRSIVLAEKGGSASAELHVQATQDFKFVATMNPGGDFGKKELSPALRNRFTEVWVPSIAGRAELCQVIEKAWLHEDLKVLTNPLLDFVDWISNEVNDHALVTIRDMKAWVGFCNAMYSRGSLSTSSSFVNGGEMTIVDGLSSLSQLAGWSPSAMKKLRSQTVQNLHSLVHLSLPERATINARISEGVFEIGPFSLPTKRPRLDDVQFNFDAPTTCGNALRLVRACQIQKPVLLEGSPGVGKTSLVLAVAEALGRKLCRINLSDQTDLVDLFGSDLPQEGSSLGEFVWRDADFLRALRHGDWVLLDEMNLANQSVLEGLNAVLDHRGTVYIPELDRSFACHPDFRIFAAQNPLHQGSGRKGLPKSFLNRFTKVFVEPLTPEDLLVIGHKRYPFLEPKTLTRMIEFNNQLQVAVVEKQEFGHEGAPWEFNLRDVMRWSSLLRVSDAHIEHPVCYLDTIYTNRFRISADRQRVREIFMRVFHDEELNFDWRPHLSVNSSNVHCGASVVSNGNFTLSHLEAHPLPLHTKAYESALASVSRSWLVIVTGASGSGKSAFIRSLGQLCSRSTQILSLSGASDTSDLVGSFEQTEATLFLQSLYDHFLLHIRSLLSESSRLSSESVVRLREARVSAVNAKHAQDVHSLARVVEELLEEFPDAALLDMIQSNRKHTSGSGSFQWVDGPLVQAMCQGSWLVLDGANLCNPSVLDRLNSLCEMGGSLVLTEKGTDQRPVSPHPNFRLFMLVNSGLGEISRAMRNRGIEISLDRDAIQEHKDILSAACRVPSPIAHATVSRHDARLQHAAIRLSLNSRSLAFSPVPRWNHTLFEDSTSKHLQRATNLMRSASLEDDEMETGLFAVLRLASSRLQRYTERWVCHTIDDGRKQRALAMLRRAVDAINSAGLKELRNDCLLASDLDSDDLALDLYFNTHLSSIYSANMHENSNKFRLLLESIFLASLLNDFVPFIQDRQESSTKESDRDTLEVVLKFIMSLQTMLCKIASDDVKVLASVKKFFLLALVLGRTLRHDKLNHSILYAVSDWATRLIVHVNDSKGELRDSLHILHQSSRLVSGWELTNIWEHLYTQETTSKAQQFLGSIYFDHSTALEIESLKEIRLRMLEAHAVKKIANTSHPSNARKTAVLNAQIEGQLDAIQNRTPWVISADRSPSALTLPWIICDLEFISSVRAFPGSGRRESASVDEFALMVSLPASWGSDCDKFVCYRHYLWAAEEPEVHPSIIAGVLNQWHRSLWMRDPILGPACLFLPSFLKSSLELRAGPTGSLRDISAQEAFTRSFVQLALRECSKGSTERRSQSIVMVLLQNILLLCSCLPSNFTAAERQRLDFLSSSAACDASDALKGAIEILRNCDAHMNVALQDSKLVPLLMSLSNRCPDQPEFIGLLGQSWMALARCFLFLYVPDVPLDPLQVQECRMSIKLHQTNWIDKQASLYLELEKKETGGSASLALLQLEGDRGELSSDFVAPTRSINLVRDTKPEELRSFWKELQNFTRDLLETRIFDDNFDESEGFIEREEMLQKSISNFVDRLRLVYQQIGDLLPAIDLALQQIRFGLRLLVLSRRMRSDTSPGQLDLVSDAMNALFILKVGSDMDASSLVKQNFNIASSLLLNLSIQAGKLLKGVTITSATSTIQSIYENLAHIWNMDISRNEEAQKKAESLYKNQSTDDEDESFVRELETLFPSFQENAEVANTEAIPKARVIDDEVALHVYKIHMALFGPQCDAESLVFRETMPVLRQKMVHAWIDSESSQFSYQLDNITLGFRLDLIRKCQAALVSDGGSGKLIGALDFYRGSDLSEIRRATDIVKTLRGALYHLSVAWPEQLVLEHLIEHCDKFMSYKSNSPLAQILSAIQQLLTHTDDWEMYADKANSLKVHREALVDLIVDWRKREARGWKTILDHEQSSFVDGLAHWWFQTYDAVVRGPVAANCDPAGKGLDAYLQTLSTLLEEFVQDSPLGQLEERLKLLNSFVVFLESACQDSPDPSTSLPVTRTRKLLQSVGSYYQQYVPQARKVLIEQRGAIEKEIGKLLQLVTWRDVNVQSMQQTATRMHRQLFRRIRKFRQVLRQSVKQFMRPDAQESATMNKDEVDESSALRSRAEVLKENATKLKSKNHLLAKYSAVTSSHLIDLSALASYHELEELFNSIVSTLEQLAKATPPKNLEKEKEASWQSALVSRKRKAWADLWKELKNIGVPSNVTPEVHALHRSTCSLMELPSSVHIDANVPFHPTLEKIQTYFNRSLANLGTIVDLAGKQHQDLTTREYQRGMNCFESLFSMATRSRSNLVASLSSFSQCSKIVRRFNAVATTGVARNSENLRVDMAAALEAMRGIVVAFETILEGIDNVRALSGGSECVDSNVENQIRDWVSKTRALANRLDSILKDAGLTVPPMLSKDEAGVLELATSQLDHSKNLLREVTEKDPRVAVLCKPVQEWLLTISLIERMPEDSSEIIPSDQDAKQQLIDCLLISAQELAKLSSSVPKAEENEDENYARVFYEQIFSTSRALRAESVLQKLQALASCFVAGSLSSDSFGEVHPLLDQYLQIFEMTLETFANWTKRIFKLVYIVGNVLAKVGAEGFCKPPEMEDGGEADNKGNLEAADGVGMGEGSGSKNANDSIEDESQIEGLQGENEGEQDEETAPAEDDAIDVDFDMGGKLEDVPDDKPEQEGDEEEDEEETPNLDDEIGGGGDEEINAVDEEFWNGDDEKEDEYRDDNQEQLGEQKKDGAAEMTAKEDDGPQDGKGGSEEEGAPEDDAKEAEGEEAEAAEVGDQDLASMEPLDEDNSPDEGKQEAEASEDDLEGAEEKTVDAPMDVPDDDDGAEEEEDGANTEAQEGVTDESKDEEGADGDDDAETAEEDGAVQSKADIRTGGSDAQQGEAGDDAGADALEKTDGRDTDVELAEDEAAEDKPLPERSPLEASRNDSTNGQDQGQGNAQTTRGDSGGRARPKPLPNPNRHLGDALQEVIRRFEEIQAPLENDVSQPDGADEAVKTSQLEYGPEDSQMQALGPAQGAKQESLKAINFADQDVDVEMEDVDEGHPDSAARVDERGDSNEQNGALNKEGDGADEVTVGLNVDNDATMEDATSPADLEEQPSTSGREVEAELQRWRHDDQPEDETPRIWQLYESLTQSLSFALCEQLRLILEPTKASRLMGDFRTGKRLNMKKIIPYIASNYTKDKIWLRRVKPSQREYQVLIALDDSKSMAQSHSIHLAFQTLALVSKALNRLEVGDVAIAKFGETAEILHGFSDGPFNDQVGTKVLENFRFRQNATNVRSLLEVTFDALRRAREMRSSTSSASADLWQLEIIISDGECQSHEQLRALLRKAEEEHVLVVFLIIDAPARDADSAKKNGQSSSILQMKQANYVNTNGQFELQMRRYMDTFPFEYFVILENVESLPDVLSDTLRQFFERISSH